MKKIKRCEYGPRLTVILIMSILFELYILSFLATMTRMLHKGGIQITTYIFFISFIVFFPQTYNIKSTNGKMRKWHSKLVWLECSTIYLEGIEQSLYN